MSKCLRTLNKDDLTLEERTSLVKTVQRHRRVDVTGVVTTKKRERGELSRPPAFLETFLGYHDSSSRTFRDLLSCEHS